MAARRVPSTTDAGRREPKPEPGRVARQAKVQLGRGARRGGAAQQGQASQEAPPPSGPAALGSLGSGPDAAPRPAASPRSPARAPLPPAARRAYLRPKVGRAASCAGAAGNQPRQDEREAAPWRPPPAAHLEATRAGLRLWRAHRSPILASL